MQEKVTENTTEQKKYKRKKYSKFNILVNKHKGKDIFRLTKQSIHYQ